MSEVIMPKMGDGMEEGTVLRWLKELGEEVETGEPIAEIETDKVALEIEAAEDGVFTQTLVAEGETVPIGTPIAMIGAAGDVVEASSEKPAAREEPEAAAAEAGATEGPRTAAPVETADRPSTKAEPAKAPPANGASARTEPVERAPGERLRASPIVKRLAAEHGIDLQVIPGTGPGGRIVKDDLTPFLTGAEPIPVAKPAATSAAVADGERPTGIPREMSRIRRTTGKRMAESKDIIPHFYVSTDVDMGAAMAFRKEVNEQITDDAGKVSINDLIVKAAAMALRDFPNLNASLEGDTLYDHENIDINIAVAIEHGLIAPFIPDTDKQSLSTIARMSKDLATRAREGGLTPEEFQGGTFTISNLGMMDVSEFIAIINPPQAAILAIGSAYDVPVFNENGEVKPGKRMKITLSADHRITDGAEVARFLQQVKQFLQQPLLMLV